MVTEKQPATNSFLSSKPPDPIPHQWGIKHWALYSLTWIWNTLPGYIPASLMKTPVKERAEECNVED